MSVDFSASYFELFGLPRAFAIDRALLDERFRELQRSVHPDRFASASGQERRLSMQQSAHINAGYATLRDPLLRGRYLLELDGHEFGDAQQTTSDPEFLMEQMELREALGAARASADPFGTLGALMDRIRAAIAALVTRLEACLDPGSGVDHATAATVLVKLQFFRKLESEAQELEVLLEDERA